MSSIQKSQKPAHVRPQLRKSAKKPKQDVLENKDADVEDLIEQTRRKMASLLVEPSSTGSDSNLNLNYISSTPSGVQFSTENDFDKPTNVTSLPLDEKKPIGILKSASRFSSKSASKQGSGKARDLDNDTLADELGIPKELDSMMGGSFSSGDTPSVKSFVKDKIVERPVKLSHSSKKANVVGGNAKIPVGAEKKHIGGVEKEDAEQPIKVIKTLSELFSFAPEATALNASAEQQTADINNEIIEANIEFNCMSTEEYDEVVKEAESSGLSLQEYVDSRKENGESDLISDNGNDSGIDNSDQNLDGDFDDENEDEIDDENDIFDFFSGDLGEEETMPPPPLRPFIIFWNALSNWITADAVDVLRKYKSECFVKSEAPITQPPIEGKEMEEQSDICLSRCAGLMNMLKMNLVKSLDDLGYSADDDYTRRLAESRLSEFIQSFDYSESMVKFQSSMWKALTVILLYIVLPRRDIAFEGRSGVVMKDETELTLPSSLRDVGLSIEEYKYLVDSAIPSLDIGSGNL
jgi:hypothetical protein